MLVFAWVLWVLFILIFSIDIASFIGAMCSLTNSDGRVVRIDIEFIPLIMHIACFVFLSIYIFS